MSEEVTPKGLVRINEPAPDFEAVTTHGIKKLSDYKGKWLILFSHPADFTPVCTTEFIGFAKNFDEFQELNTDLIGLSIDSVYSHIAWVRNIKENFGVEIKFPVIADLDMKVASSYGLIHPQAATTAAVRAVFVIDPDQKVRAIVYYPLTTGRDIKEFVRVIKALQTTDKHGIATPEAWQPGDKVIVPPPTTDTDAAERVEKAEYDVTDWYFSKKDV